MDTFDKLRRLVAAWRHIPPESITPDTRLNDILTASLDFVELIMVIEEEFAVEVPEGVAERLSLDNSELTFGKLAAELDRLAD